MGATHDVKDHLEVFGGSGTGAEGVVHFCAEFGDVDFHSGDCYSVVFAYVWGPPVCSHGGDFGGSHAVDYLVRVSRTHFML